MFDLRDFKKEFNLAKQISVDRIIEKTNKLNKQKEKEKENYELIQRIKKNSFKQNVKELKEYLGGEVQFWIFIVFMFTIGLPLLLEAFCLYFVIRLFCFLLIF